MEGTKGTVKDVKPGGSRDVFGLPGQIDSRFVLAMNDAIEAKQEEKGEWRACELRKEHLLDKALTHLLDFDAAEFDAAAGLEARREHLIDAANYTMMLWYVLEKEGGA